MNSNFADSRIKLRRENGDSPVNQFVFTVEEFNPLAALLLIVGATRNHRIEFRFVSSNMRKCDFPKVVIDSNILDQIDNSKSIVEI